MSIKLKKSFWLVCLALLLQLAHAAPAYSETSIVIVDVQMLLTESEAAKNIQQQVEQKRDALQSEFAGYESKLRESEKQLMENRASMDTETFNKKREEFQTSLQETSQVVQKKRRNLEAAVVKATDKLRNEILKIVASISEANKYDIVLTRQNIVIVDKSLDISQQVLEKLNSTITGIPLEIEE